MVGAYMFLTGKWVMPGVHNVEEFDPDPFLEKLAASGLPWHVIENEDIELEA
jgi:saccharopine dehydrogenase (NAD+, L-lysine-forming)